VSNSLIVNHGIAAQNDATTRFYGLVGDLDPETTEVNCEIPVRDAGTFSNLFVYVTTNTASVTSTVTLRKSQADTSLTVSYTSDQTGIKEDNVNTVSFAATDEGNYEVTIPTEAGTNTLTFWANDSAGNLIGETITWTARESASGGGGGGVLPSPASPIARVNLGIVAANVRQVVPIQGLVSVDRLEFLTTAQTDFAVDIEKVHSLPVISPSGVIYERLNIKPKAFLLPIFQVYVLNGQKTKMLRKPR